ncbi:MAG TPA: hypothetical protein VME21_11865 [Steroidobacteraceae bacterium]|nr:hypothetical protein [Steroidobacteraceae bacterium]
MAEAHKIRKHPSTSVRHPHQVAIAFESINIRGLTGAERQKAIRRLARVLMQAAGILGEENGDER